MFYKELVYEMYIMERASQRFKSIFSNKSIEAVFNFLVQADQVDQMIKSTMDSRPALEGVIESVEDFMGTTYDIDNNLRHRQITGSMVRFIMGHYGYMTDKSKLLKKGKYIKTAIVYKCFE